MPVLASRLLCSGCSACATICPHNAITMCRDEEGFLRPNVDPDRCVECKVCEKACHVVNPFEEHIPLEVFAAKAKSDSIRLPSSSGGIFPLLAQSFIHAGGIVWGVEWCFDNPIPYARHNYADCEEKLEAFRGSKYVQSFIGNSYKRVKSQLLKGENVIFSGTPCQIAGLKHYLGKDYPNLTCCEVICHGASSPKVFHDYIESLLPQTTQDSEYRLKDIRFRDKTHLNRGWRNGVVVVVVAQVTSAKGESKEIYLSDKRADADPYLRAFLGELINRPSCHSCTAKSLKSHADITLGDFWKIHKYAPSIDDNMGVSLVCINTERGKQAFDLIKPQLSDCVSTTWEAAIDSTGALIGCPLPHRHRQKFFKRYVKEGFNPKYIAKLLRPTMKQIFQQYIRIFKNKIRPYIKR